MKRILCLVLLVLMLLPTLVFADISGEMTYAENSQSVYIAGNLSEEGKHVTLLITDKSTKDIKYIAQFTTDKNGEYEAKFKFDGDLSECDITLKEGDNVVNSSVNVAYSEQPSMYSLELTDENGSNYIEAEEILKITTKIRNTHNNGGEYKILVAFYGETGKLIGCHTVADGRYDLAEINKEVTEYSDVRVPENTVTIKAFLWENARTIIPLSGNVVKKASDKRFDGENGQIRVAFIGDSITHMGYYIRGIEHYYHTRYPNKDIVFINKGTSGNRTDEVISRFEWDITEDEISGKIDEATMMIGMNDNSSAYYQPGTSYTKEDVDARIGKYIANVENIIKKFRKAGVSLTIITPSLYDDTEGFTEGNENRPERNSYGLNNLTARLKKLAEKYDIPVIDMWTATTEVTNYVRETYDYAGPVITAADRTHPGSQGGFYISYEFARQQDGNPIVASVEVDAESGIVSTENATVNVIFHESDRVEYEYLAGAIPFAYTSHYQKYENEWEVPITEDINQEIIRITGLDDGTYKIKIGDNTLSAVYTAEELSEGVNIAIDANNPAQIQSQEAYSLALTKASNEDKYRGIAITEQQFRQKGLNYDDFNENMAEEEFKVVGSWPAAHKKYFSTNPDDYGSKMYEVENWEKIRQQEQAAREAARPVRRTVVIEKQ